MKIVTLLYICITRLLADMGILYRFYSAMYKKLLDPHLATSAHQAMFINLVYKALSKDTNMERVRVIIKRLLQVSKLISCGPPYNISPTQVCAKKAIWTLYLPAVVDIYKSISFYIILYSMVLYFLLVFGWPLTIMTN